jgi:hypothetical protein
LCQGRRRIGLPAEKSGEERIMESFDRDLRNKVASVGGLLCTMASLDVASWQILLQKSAVSDGSFGPFR